MTHRYNIGFQAQQPCADAEMSPALADTQLPHLLVQDLVRALLLRIIPAIKTRFVSI